jgi:hypothetical protein
MNPLKMFTVVVQLLTDIQRVPVQSTPITDIYLIFNVESTIALKVFIISTSVPEGMGGLIARRIHKHRSRYTVPTYALLQTMGTGTR